MGLSFTLFTDTNRQHKRRHCIAQMRNHMTSHSKSKGEDRNIKKIHIKHAWKDDYLPSDHSTLQVINLDKFTKAAGVVVVGCLGITKGLAEIRKDRNTQ